MRLLQKRLFSMQSVFYQRCNSVRDHKRCIPILLRVNICQHRQDHRCSDSITSSHKAKERRQPYGPQGKMIRLPTPKMKVRSYSLTRSLNASHKTIPTTESRRTFLRPTRSAIQSADSARWDGMGWIRLGARSHIPKTPYGNTRRKPK
jgi:hypothetical protein